MADIPLACEDSHGFANCETGPLNGGGDSVLIRLRPNERKVFILLSAEDKKYSGADIYKALNKPKDTVYRAIRRLKGLGLIEEENTYPKSYALTKLGRREVSQFNAGDVGELRILDRSHNWEFKAGVLEDREGLTDSWRVQEGMRGGNWFRRDIELYRGFVVEVVRTPSNFLFRFNDASLLARDSYTAEALAFGIAGQVKNRLEGDYRGLRLGFPERVHVQLVKAHHARVNDEFASWCKANNVSIRGGVLSVDASKDLPELEADGAGRASYSVEDFARVHTFLEDVASGRLKPLEAFNYLSAQGLGLARAQEDFMQVAGHLLTGTRGLLEYSRAIHDEVQKLKMKHGRE